MNQILSEVLLVKNTKTEKAKREEPREGEEEEAAFWNGFEAVFA